MSQQTAQFRLSSDRLIFVPLTLAEAVNGYLLDLQRERLVDGIATLFDLKPDVAEKILSGEIEYEVDGEDVVFRHTEEPFVKEAA